MHNIVVLCQDASELEQLREWVNDESNEASLTNSYNRAEWNGMRSDRPYEAKVVGCKSKKKAFELRLKFQTLPYKGVEF